MSTIPHKFNRLGLSKGSSFDLEKGLLFHAPLQENFDAIGGSVYSHTGWVFQDSYFGKKCVYGSTSTAGIYYKMANPIQGIRAYTISIEFFSLDFTGDNRSLFYIGTNILNHVFGFEFEPTGGIGTAWGDKYTYDTAPYWKDYVNAWTTFTATYDMQRIRIYFNGELKFTSDPVTIDITTNGGYTYSYARNGVNLYIGSRWGDYRYWKNGLRNNYIYDYALSDQDVKAFYEATKGM